MGQQPSSPAGGAAGPGDQGDDELVLEEGGRRDGAVGREVVDPALRRLVGPDPIAASDPFWTVALETLHVGEDTAAVPDQVAETVMACSAAMLTNNPRSGNLRAMLLALVAALEEVPRDGSGPSRAVLNHLFLAREFLCCVLDQVPRREREVHLGPDPGASPAPAFAAGVAVEADFLPAAVVHQLLGALAEVPLTHATRDLHAELVNFLLAVVSAPLRSCAEGDGSVFHEALTQGERPRELAAEVLQALLYNFSEGASASLREAFVVPASSRPPSPSQRQPPASSSSTTTTTSTSTTTASSTKLRSSLSLSQQLQQGGKGGWASVRVMSLLSRLRRGVVSLIRWPIALFSLLFPAPVAADPLAERSAFLFLLLFHQGPGADGQPNPYRGALGALLDAGDMSGAGGGGPLSPARAGVRPLGFAAAPAHVVRLDFGRVYESVVQQLPRRWAVTVLYSLLYCNPAFREYVLAKADLDRLVVPLLERLYRAADRPGGGGPGSYVALVVLLMLSRDAAFGDTVHSRVTLGRVAWYREVALSQVSLGSLMTLVLVRLVASNTARGRDSYLHSNCLAVLSNLAPQAAHLHPEAARRLVQLLELAARRCAPLRLAPGAEGTDGAAAGEGAAALLDFTALLLTVCSAMLNVHHLADNVHLVYWLLTRREGLAPLLRAPEGSLASSDRLGPCVRRIGGLLDHFERCVARAQAVDSSLDHVLRAVRADARLFQGTLVGGAAPAAAPKFTFQEEEHPEGFFLPHIWRAVSRTAAWGGDPLGPEGGDADSSSDEESDPEEVPRGDGEAE